MAIGCLIKEDALVRADIIDSELDWDSGLAIGRLANLWSKAQGAGTNIVKRRLILEWARVAAKDADLFLALCCKVKASKDDESNHIHFLEPRPDGCYYIVGNPEQIQKIETFKRRASAGGHAKAEKERAAKAASDPGSASSRTSSSHQAELQADSEHASSSAISLPSSSSSSSSSSVSLSSSNLVEGQTPLDDRSGKEPPKTQDEEADLTPSQWDTEAAQWMRAQVSAANPDAVRLDKADIRTWANVFRLMRERDHLTQEQVQAGLLFTFNDPFWKARIQSPGAFRAKWNALSAQMNNQKPQGYREW